MCAKSKIFRNVLIFLLISVLSGQFMDCLDSLWIVWTVYGLSGQFFLDRSDNFRYIRIAFGLFRQFLECMDSLG